jgi:hypothetical protein
MRIDVWFSFLYRRSSYRVRTSRAEGAADRRSGARRIDASGEVGSSSSRRIDRSYANRPVATQTAYRALPE